MKTTRFYHHTWSAERAESIMRDGFKNRATTINVMPSPSLFYSPRVWFGKVPVIAHEFFENVYGKDLAEEQAYIAIDVPMPVRGIKSSDNPKDAAETLNEDGSMDGIMSFDHAWPCVQYWTRAEILNKFPRTRLQLDDIIKLRLTTNPMLICRLKQRLRQEQQFYKFEIRLAKILIKHFHVETSHFRKQLIEYEEDAEADRLYCERLNAAEAEADEDDDEAELEHHM
jgi:hypothetical protein